MGTLQAKCESITQHIHSEEVTKGTWKDSLLHDYYFTVYAGDKAVGNLTLHNTDGSLYSVGQSYTLTI